jgi:hypothetical protein
VKAFFPRFVEKTAKEKDCLFYEFTSDGEEMFCREAYETAEALLAEMLKMSDLTRIEVRPATELEKLKAPLAHLNPKWFTLERN